MFPLIPSQAENSKIVCPVFTGNQEKTYLWSCLHFTGISVFNNFVPKSRIRRLFHFWFPIFLHIALLNSVFVLITGYQTGMWRIDVMIACAFVNILSVSLWHSIHFKRKLLTNLVSQMNEVCSSQTSFHVKNIEAITTNGVLFLYAITPTALALLCVSSISERSQDIIWTYGYKLEDLSSYFRVLCFFNVNVYVSLQVIFPGLLTCMYCTLCHRISKLLSCYKYKLMKVFNGSLTMPSKLLVSQYFAILHVVDLLQNLFTEPIFLLILMNFLHMFSMLGYFISFFKHQFTIVVIGEVVIVVATTTLSTVVIIIFASKITATNQSIKKMFQRYKESRILASYKGDGAVFQLAIERENVLLSACDVVFFRKSLILSIFGALLTYSLLIFQIIK
ncbi:uncharacterized protein TNIN_196021 [Trichonephila inaurata madagascariensis]|uniref:Uncharacterized protein n=1 Tax=Trichonephila inaurata madagascariensis TaxID=2747483 RepID=A0A8X6XX33_9ARAC|nr:uncharacterized protein TNIN_196021 [Trichonephila inaurata madagascariensis]